MYMKVDPLAKTTELAVPFQGEAVLVLKGLPEKDVPSVKIEPLLKVTPEASTEISL